MRRKKKEENCGEGEKKKLFFKIKKNIRERVCFVRIIMHVLFSSRLWYLLLAWLIGEQPAAASSSQQQPATASNSQQQQKSPPFLSNDSTKSFFPPPPFQREQRRNVEKGREREIEGFLQWRNKKILAHILIHSQGDSSFILKKGTLMLLQWNDSGSNGNNKKKEEPF